MRTVLALVLSVVALASVAASAAADQIYFGHADGVIEHRDEFDMIHELQLPGTGASSMVVRRPLPRLLRFPNRPVPCFFL